MHLVDRIDRWWRHITHGWHRTNCLFFAVALFVRRHARIRQARKDGEGGPDRKLIGRRHYFQARVSDSGWFPHFLYEEEMPYSGLRRISYKPPNPVERKCPPILFRGGVRWGDAPHSEH